MKALAITQTGIEEIAALEIKELLGKKAGNIHAGRSVISFDAEDYADLCLLCYKAQSLTRVLLLLESAEFKNLDDIGAGARKISKSEKLNEFLTANTRFMVRCRRKGEHDFSSHDVEEEVGKHINGEVDLEEPDVTVYAYINHKEYHIGIDFAGFDLSKRQYRVFNYRETLKATVAYAMLRIAGYKARPEKAEKIILDPFCGSGTIPIEAALYATGFPVNYFNKKKFAFLGFECLKDTDLDRFFEKIDKKVDLKKKTGIHGYDSQLGYVKATQNNAKIAGIDKNISISKADVEWLDTKMKENEADMIVTHPVQVTERNKNSAGKLYRELFHQADFILNKNGRMVLAAGSEQTKDLLKKRAMDYKFRLKKELSIRQGKMQLDILLFER